MNSKDARCCAESTLLSVSANGRERIGDHGHEQVDKPKVEDEHSEDEEKARDEILGINGLVHDRRPLKYNR
jgi:hypothetical protein